MNQQVYYFIRIKIRRKVNSQIVINQDVLIDQKLLIEITPLQTQLQNKIIKHNKMLLRKNLLRTKKKFWIFKHYFLEFVETLIYQMQQKKVIQVNTNFNIILILNNLKKMLEQQIIELLILTQRNIIIAKKIYNKDSVLKIFNFQYNNRQHRGFREIYYQLIKHQAQNSLIQIQKLQCQDGTSVYQNDH
ncbi:unnamed protein product [Paramecium sonneborni]|uniref:Uncharacterized protein n=1 Tax=Paramecium sonneborni TaxID=65129 RepID=A0A8S1RB61_9CILI|nr:unnamed protein product [Paramecium sonneborni]